MLFCASEGTPLEVAVKLAGCLGLRRSEICGLKWCNVDLKRGVLTVCEVRTAVSGRALEKAPKSYASERWLAFGGSEDLEALLKRLYRDWERRRKQDPKYNPEGYVAVNEAGKPYQPDVLCQRIAQFIAAQGLPPISLHGAAPQLCERCQRPECADVQHLEGAGAQLNIRDERGVYAPFRRRGGGRRLAGGERHHGKRAVSVRETETAARAGQEAATAALAAPFP